MSDSLHTLSQLVADAATGELVCASAEAEVHIHLQGGRVAWATSSASRFAFGRYVLERCDLDAQALKELIAECRREHKPLGETLIEWGVASTDAVRDALREQIVDALSTLRDAGAAQTVFLQRGAGYRSYNPTFTFALDEVAPRRSRTPASGTARTARRSSRPAPGSLSARLAALVADEPEIRWAEHHENGAPSCRVPLDARPAGIHAPAHALMKGDVDFVVARGCVENLVGVALPAGAGSVWCGVDPQAVLGGVVTSLRERLGVEHARASARGAAMGGIHIGPDRGIGREILAEILERTPTVWAVAIADHAARAHCLARRDAVDPTALESRLVPFTTLLRAARPLTVGTEPDVALPRASLAAAAASGWLFGGELLDETRRDLWLLLDPGAGQGLGWAILEALLRRTSLTSRELPR